ncbi:MAG: hypothetical protein AO396_07540 [Candidatus Fermentibacter daniensis]|nr:MAG: hypothetical protein AO396_07540 [Candidatus Fermentibacter daniensis]
MRAGGSNRSSSSSWGHAVRDGFSEGGPESPAVHPVRMTGSGNRRSLVLAGLNGVAFQHPARVSALSDCGGNPAVYVPGL